MKKSLITLGRALGLAAMTTAELKKIEFNPDLSDDRLEIPSRAK